MQQVKKVDKNLIGLAGEYHVLAQLAQRGYVAAMTLGHTKGVDILVAGRARKLWRVEVKTTRRGLSRSALFGPRPFYSWQLTAKHESLRAPELVYCFVALEELGALPRFFLVPAANVALYLKWEHRFWRRRSRGRPNDIRMFRVPDDDPERYHDNWTLLR